MIKFERGDFPEIISNIYMIHTAKELHALCVPYENICQYAKSLWRFPLQSRLLDVSLSPIRNVGYIAPSINATKLSASNEAPPIKPPSISS